MKKSRSIKVFVIDDQPIIAIGLATLFKSEERLELCGSARSGEVVPEDFNFGTPDLFVLEINLHFIDGFDLLKRLHRRFPDSPILIFSHRDESFYAERALQCGAMGYVMKSEDTAHIVDALNSMLRGEFYVSERLRSLLFSGVRPEQHPERANPVKMLSTRELQVLQLTGQGKSNHEIARIMRIRQKTVEAHRFRIREKLNLRHGAELTQFAVHWAEQSGAVGE